MESLSCSRTALVEATILAFVVAPIGYAFVFAPETVEGGGSGAVGLYLHLTGPTGHAALAAFFLLALAALAFRSLRLLLGSRTAAGFGPDGVELDNGWRKRKAAWADVLGAAVETRRVRVRGTERSFDYLVVSLCGRSGSADRIKFLLRELNADWSIAQRWCETLREARQQALHKAPARQTSAPQASPALRTFGRRVVDRPNQAT